MGRIIHRSDLRPGQLVQRPEYYRDPDGQIRPFAEVWPDAPLVCRVGQDWHANDDGDSVLEDPASDAHCVLNDLDWPEAFTLAE